MSRHADLTKRKPVEGIAPSRRDAEDTAQNWQHNPLSSSKRLNHRPPNRVVVKAFAGEFFRHPKISPIDHNTAFEVTL